MLVLAEYEIEKNWEDLCCMLDELIYNPNHAPSGTIVDTLHHLLIF